MDTPLRQTPAGRRRLAPIGVKLLALQAGIGIAALGLLFWELGWPLSSFEAYLSEWVTWSLIVLALIAEIGLASRSDQSPLRRNLILSALGALAIARFVVEFPLRDWLGVYVPPRSAALGALVVVQLTLIVPLAFRMLRLTRSAVLQSARPGSLFVASFLLAIAAGTLLLKTPQATTGGISWMDSLFTSTSAVCVTGLIVVDTESAFTSQGQFIILMLIQAGGLGIMTLTYFLSLVVGQGITLRDSARLKELFSEENVGAIGKFVAAIVVVTLSIEAIGALLIYASWNEQPARPGNEVWDAIFHSVSAFCNAGFSTFAAGLADPGIAQNRELQAVVMLLIIAGGLGFAVLHDLPRLALRLLAGLLKRLFPNSRRAIHFYVSRRIRLHTQLTLQTTGILLITGAIILFLSEGWTLSGERIWEAAFNSVTARTAGFNITDFSSYTFASVVCLCFLMFVGGSPGGTAGGIKTTTFAVAIAELARLIRGRQSLHLRRRRIPRDIVERCSATIVVSLVWVTLSIFAIGWSHPRLDAVDVIFECFSAFGTVGLSRGITDELSNFGKLVIIASMFAGRIGLMTFILTIAGQPRPRHYELPEGRLPLN